MFMTAFVTVVAAYLIGSINFAVIFMRAFTAKDIREFGSGNAGTTNVMRVGGKLPGILTFVCDALKGAVGALMGRLIFDYISRQPSGGWAAPIYGAYLCGLACMLGHIFPIFFQFKGGKGVAISVGIYAVCCWPAIVIGLTGFAIVLLITKIVSLSSLIATVLVVSLSLVFRDHTAFFWPQAVLSLLMGAAVFLKHKDNIRRLLAGEESRIGSGRKR